MLDIFNTPTPQNCNFQEFYYQGTNATNGRLERWEKPRGCSMVRFLLIGAGGGGSSNATTGGAGGGSGAITSLLIPAMFVPDSIIVQVGTGGVGAAASATSASGSSGNNTILFGYFTSSSIVTLLSATGGNAASGSAGTGGAGGAVSLVNYFSSAGIAQSVAGQTGANSNTNLVATSTIPLMGGAGGRPNGSTRSATPNYGYPEADSGSATKAASGYFQLSPILLGCGGGGGGNNNGSVTNGGIGGDGGIGCGGGGGGSDGTTGFAGGKGGNGAAFIWAW